MGGREVRISQKQKDLGDVGKVGWEKEKKTTYWSMNKGGRERARCISWKPGIAPLSS